jgi:hypothetical protein
MKIAKKDFILGLIFLITSVFFLVFSPERHITDTGLGAGYLPWILSIGLLTISILTIIKSFFKND